MLLWAISLMIEVVLLAGMWERRGYSLFRAYLVLDLLSSIGLYVVACVRPQMYDVCWRTVQLGMLVPRAAVAMDVYRTMSATRRYWRFADVGGIPIAASAALIFRLAQDTPLRWPWSSLEQVFIAVGTFNAFLAMALLTILTAQHRRSLLRTEDFWHGALFLAYLSVTSICYFGAARFGSASTILMVTACAFYALRLFLSLAAEPGNPVPPAVDWMPEEQRW